MPHGSESLSDPATPEELADSLQLEQAQRQLQSLLDLTGKKGSEWESQICAQLSALFSSPAQLSAAFLQKPSSDFSGDDTLKPNAAGIDFRNVRTLYDNIGKMDLPSVSKAVIEASSSLIEDNKLRREEETRPNGALPKKAKMLIRAWLIIFANPSLLEPENQDLLQSVAKALTNLGPHGSALVVSTLASLPSEYLEELVATVQQCITLELYEASRVTESVQLCTKLLKILYDANFKSRRLPISTFYNDAVNNKDLVDPERQYLYWKKSQRYAFSFCSFPFVLDLSTKCRILQIESSIQKNQHLQRAFFDGLFNAGGFIEPFFVLRVRRDNLIHDAITHVQRNHDDLKKPLRVQFVGEDAVDEGGVRKEFFLLVVQELFDPKYGMFSYSEDSRLFWFSLQPGELGQIQRDQEQMHQEEGEKEERRKREGEQGERAPTAEGTGVSAMEAHTQGGASLSGSGDMEVRGAPPSSLGEGFQGHEQPGSTSDGLGMGSRSSSSRRGIAVEDIELRREYELVGTLLGLALYNSCILDVHFPSAVYKKLLGRSMVLEDLESVDKDLAKGLRDLLAFDGDVEEVYSRTFQVSVNDVYGCSHDIDLKPGGSLVPLTKENRKEYVDLCVKFYLETSVERQFHAFAQGFKHLVPEHMLKLFEPEELELLICGSSELDFNELEKGAEYTDGYVRGHKSIHQFWEVANALSEEDKRNLLMFVTGCDRAPVRGLASLKFTISRNGPDSDRLPSAHTCFNHLLLPEYSSKEKLESRLLTAIHNAKGFGLH